MWTRAFFASLPLSPSSQTSAASAPNTACIAFSFQALRAQRGPIAQEECTLELTCAPGVIREASPPTSASWRAAWGARAAGAPIATNIAAAGRPQAAGSF
jgi:hypothetical protein